MTVDPEGDVFAMLSSSGIYRSTDRGGSWESMNTALSFGYEAVFMSDSSNNIYAGSVLSGLYESTDRGISWNKTSLPGGASAAAIISRNRLCIGGQQTVSVSNDSGKTWSLHQVRADPGDASSLAEDSSGNIFAGFYYRSFGTYPYGGGIYVSSDAGRTWKFDGMAGSTILSIVVDKTGNVFLLATSNGTNNNIYSAVANSNNWIEAAPGIPLAANTAALQIDHLGEVVAVTDMGIYVYSNSSHTWQVVSPVVSDAYITAAIYDPTGLSYEGTGGDGIYFLDNPTAAWLQCGVFPSSITSLGIDNGGTLYAGTEDGIYIPGSAPGTWRRVSDGLGHGTVYQIRISMFNKMLYAATGNGLFYFFNDRNYWVLLTYQQVYDFVETPNGDYAGTSAGIWTADNSLGAIWNQLQTIGLPLTSIYCIALDSSGNLYAGTTGDGVFESTDGGTLWTETGINSPIIFSSVGTIKIDSKGRMFAGTDTTGAYYSDDSGSDWNRIPSISGRDITYFLVNHPPEYFAGTSDRGVFMSRDRGLSWESVNTGMEDSSVASLAFDQFGYLYAATDSGIFKSSRIVNAIDEPAPSSTSFSLNQNYPNPFNPSTVISYQLSVMSHVTLKVYDALGREVKTLLNEVRRPGIYQVQFDGVGFAAGVYFYRLTAGNLFETRKMILIK